MVRKNLLDGLMEAPAPAPTVPFRRTGPDGARRGAIGAVSQGIAELRARALVDLDAELIDAGGLEDRLEQDTADQARLIASIAEHGQQVPVLVRPAPSGRYQIVYGRRRVAACRALGRPVRALVRDLDDQALIVAQGQENSARRDLSFIEKANFARQMVEAGFRQKLVAEALHIDKSGVSRLLKVAQAVPPPVIRAIGAAPGVGRDRWMALADRIAHAALAEAGITELAKGGTSEARFEAVAAGLAAAAPEPASKTKAKTPLADPDSTSDGASGDVRDSASCPDDDPRHRMKLRYRRAGGGSILEVEGHPAFTRWLSKQIPRLRERWLEGEQ